MSLSVNNALKVAQILEWIADESRTAYEDKEPENQGRWLAIGCAALKAAEMIEPAYINEPTLSITHQ